MVANELEVAGDEAYRNGHAPRSYLPIGILLPPLRLTTKLTILRAFSKF